MSPPMFAHAQQPGPLEGQGVDPMSAGLRDMPQPVYMSVDLLKLVKVDQKEYNFAAVFTVVQAWQDERVAEMSTVIAASAVGKRAAAAQRMAKCSAEVARRRMGESTATATATSSRATTTTATSSSSSNSVIREMDGGDSNSISCLRAADDADLASSCGRKCVTTDVFLCCDEVWLPSFMLPNLLVLSQDRFLADGVYFPRAFDPSLVMRVTRVEGVFSSAFNFASFPFDRQILSVRIDAGNLGYFITPSLVDRGFMSTSLASWNMTRFGNFSLPFANDTDPWLDGVLPLQLPQVFPQQFPTDEVTEWRITGLELVCPPMPRRLSLADSYIRGLNPADPSFEPYRVSLNATTRNSNFSCTFNIHVSRLSSNYVLTLIIPTMLTVFLSLAAFFARPADLDIRLPTAVTLFLTLVAVQFVIDDQLPKTQNITAFGILVLISYFVICTVVVESILVFHIHHYEEGFLRRRRLQKEEEERRRQRRAGLGRGRSGGGSGKSLLSGKSFFSRPRADSFMPSVARTSSSGGLRKETNRDVQLGERSNRPAEAGSLSLPQTFPTQAHTPLETFSNDEGKSRTGAREGIVNGNGISGKPESQTTSHGGGDVTNYHSDVRPCGNKSGYNGANPVLSDVSVGDREGGTENPPIPEMPSEARYEGGNVSGREEGEMAALLESEPPVPFLADRLFCKLVNSNDEAVWLAEQLDSICFCVLFGGYFLAAILIFTLR